MKEFQTREPNLVIYENLGKNKNSYYYHKKKKKKEKKAQPKMREENTNEYESVFKFLNEDTLSVSYGSSWPQPKAPWALQCDLIPVRNSICPSPVFRARPRSHAPHPRPANALLARTDLVTLHTRGQQMLSLLRLSLDGKSS